MQQAAEQSRQNDAETLNASVQALKTANDQLGEVFAKELKSLNASLQWRVEEQLKAALKKNVQETAQKTQELCDAFTRLHKQTRAHLADYKEKQRRFFAFDNVRTFLFWAEMVSNIVVLLLTLMNKIGG